MDATTQTPQTPQEMHQIALHILNQRLAALESAKHEEWSATCDHEEEMDRVSLLRSAVRRLRDIHENEDDALVGDALEMLVARLSRYEDDLNAAKEALRAARSKTKDAQRLVDQMVKSA